MYGFIDQWVYNLTIIVIGCIDVQIITEIESKDLQNNMFIYVHINNGKIYFRYN